MDNNVIYLLLGLGFMWWIGKSRNTPSPDLKPIEKKIEDNNIALAKEEQLREDIKNEKNSNESSVDLINRRFPNE